MSNGKIRKNAQNDTMRINHTMVVIKYFLCVFLDRKSSDKS